MRHDTSTSRERNHVRKGKALYILFPDNQEAPLYHLH
jgi:hypothetical protein